MKTSLIIPTLNRRKDLGLCLDSIYKLTQGFDEIIIVEQGDIDSTKRLVSTFTTLNIRLYFHPIKSAAQARNKGIEHASGEVLFFIDDDTELSCDYVEVAQRYFTNNASVMGLTGQIIYPSAPNINNYLIRLLKKTYWWFHKIINILLLYDGINMRILRSGTNTHGVRVCKKPCDVEWIQGCHMAFRKVVFEHFSFNANFILWSCAEDAILSYQVYQYYGRGALRYLPDFKLIHHQGEEVSCNNTQLVKMQIIYQFICWHQCIYQHQFINVIAYLYGQLGYVKFLLSFYPWQWQTLKTIVKTYLFLFKHWRGVANNSVDYNDFILKDTKK